MSDAGSPVRGPHAERSRVTQARIVGAARTRFGRDGYAAVTVDDVAADAGITKGAVYHHFPAKAALLEAVVVDEHRRLWRRVGRALRRSGGSGDDLRVACRAYLGALSGPDGLAHLVFVEAPAVLGWQRWRQLDDETWQRDLDAAVAGRLPPGDGRGPALAHVIS